MLKRTKVLKYLMSLPDYISSDELIDGIILLEKIQIGMDQAKQGKNYTLKEAQDKLACWKI